MLLIIKGQTLISFLKTPGFVIIKQKGSHVRMRSEDGSYTTIPIHSGEEIPKGLVRRLSVRTWKWI